MKKYLMKRFNYYRDSSACFFGLLFGLLLFVGVNKSSANGIEWHNWLEATSFLDYGDAYNGTFVYVLKDPDLTMVPSTPVKPAGFDRLFFFSPTLFSPDPFQLRVQDLRGNECYAQPDALEVCGAGDTIPFLLFTKSVVPLQDIRIDISFEDGIEYGGFAYVDNTLAESGAELDTISVDNPEAPSFLLDQVSEATGGVVLYVGVRAECGVDFSINNPDITLDFSYKVLLVPGPYYWKIMDKMWLHPKW